MCQCQGCVWEGRQERLSREGFEPPTSGYLTRTLNTALLRCWMKSCLFGSLYGCNRPVNTYIPHVVDVDGRLVVVLARGGLGMVRIVFYGPDYPGAGV